jgi:hypothetical protein
LIVLEHKYKTSGLDKKIFSEYGKKLTAENPHETVDSGIESGQQELYFLFTTHKKRVLKTGLLNTNTMNVK